MISVERQAKLYGEWAKARGLKSVAVYPVSGRGPESTAERARRCVIAAMLGCSPNDGPWTCLSLRDVRVWLERQATKEDVTLQEVDPSDYDRKLYKHELEGLR